MSNKESGISRRIFKAASKEHFLEFYDSLNIGKIMVMITKYDSGTDKSTRKPAVNTIYYVGYQEMLGLCEMIISGTFDMYCTSANDKSWPQTAYGIPSGGAKMRHWSLRHLPNGPFMLRLQERENNRGDDKWSTDAPLLSEGTFSIPPSTAVVMASKVKMYIYSWYGENCGTLSVNEKGEETFTNYASSQST